MSQLPGQTERQQPPGTLTYLTTGLLEDQRKETKELSAILTVYKDVYLVVLCQGLRLSCPVQSALRMTRNSLIMATSAPVQCPHSTAVDIDCLCKQTPACRDIFSQKTELTSGIFWLLIDFSRK